jgi:hypothetical protein
MATANSRAHNLHEDELRNAYRGLVIKPEKKRPPRRHRRRKILQEVLGRTIRLVTFDTTRYIWKSEKLRTIYKDKDSNVIS